MLKSRHRRSTCTLRSGTILGQNNLEASNQTDLWTVVKQHNESGC